MTHRKDNNTTLVWYVTFYKFVYHVLLLHRNGKVYTFYTKTSTYYIVYYYHENIGMLFLCTFYHVLNNIIRTLYVRTLLALLLCMYNCITPFLCKCKSMCCSHHITNKNITGLGTLQRIYCVHTSAYVITCTCIRDGI
jgi:hypothetical protein